MTHEVWSYYPLYIGERAMDLHLGMCTLQVLPEEVVGAQRMLVYIALDHRTIISVLSSSGSWERQRPLL